MNATDGRTRLGVVGWPVAHSRSPAMHNAALQAVGLAGWRYQQLPVPLELFEETVRALAQAGFRGVNVTIPHKRAALRLADQASARAGAIGAANTLCFDADGAIQSDNTDGPALIQVLPLSAAGATAMVLGAGGSARAAVWALLDAGARDVLVWNRTPERARRLCAELGGRPVASPEPADLLVHCTSSGLDASDSAFAQLPLAADELHRYRCVIDFVYRESGTSLIEAAREASLLTVDGFELLVGQGALSFESFTGARAPVDVMRGAVTGRQ